MDYPQALPVDFLRKEDYSMICYKCGQELPDKSRICPNCRADLTVTSATTASAAPVASANVQGDKGSVGLKILSFIIPLAGIILFFVKKDENRTAAKSYLKMAIISIVLGIVGSILLVMGSVGLFIGVNKGLAEGIENGDIQISDDFDYDFENGDDVVLDYDTNTQDEVEFELDNEIDGDVSVNFDFFNDLENAA